MKNLLTNLRNGLQTLFKKLEHAVGPFAKIGIGLLVLATAVGAGSLLRDKSDITTSTVMITSLNERGGGSGVIVGINDGKTQILTNRHVCEVAVNGGLVKTTKGQKHTILFYQESKLHDLCLITVAAELEGRVSLASSAPRMYEHAIVSGHPALLPNVITEGHFSGNKIVEVFMGNRDCTKEELEDETMEPICKFFGQLPVVRTFETVLVTATIMPGSSGSAVYNGSKELSAVIFAGSSGIGYGFAVPYEFVSNFFNNELQSLEIQYPTYELDVKSLIKNQSTKTKRLKDLERKCIDKVDTIEDSIVRLKIEQICETVLRDMNWRN